MESVAEEWRAVEQYEGWYEVSNLGRVRSLSRIVNCGVAYKRRTRERILKPIIGRTSVYPTASLSKAGSKPRISQVHRLVAAAFLGPVPCGKEVNHKNGIKADARLCNLEYVTHAQNIRHAMDTGLWREPGTPTVWGERHGMARLSNDNVRELRSLAATHSTKELAAMFGISTCYTQQIVSRRYRKLA